MRACPICRSLSAVKAPRAVVSFVVSPLPGTRPRWSRPMSWPPAQEVPYPARVRFYDKHGHTYWPDVVVDPAQESAVPVLALPRREVWMRQVWKRDRQAHRQKVRRQVAARVAALEAEIEKLKRERGAT